MKKTIVFVLSVFILSSPKVESSSLPSVQDFFHMDSDELVIRPLKSTERRTAWKIENTGETEKFVQMFHEDDEKEAPQHSKIGTIFSNQRSLLSRPWTIVQDKESLDSMGGHHNYKLYFGVFSKEKTRSKSAQLSMVGVVNLGNFIKRGDYIWFEYMFDPLSRGKGYGTRSVHIIRDFLQRKEIIPKEGEDPQLFPYKGIKAIVDYENKPSLAVMLKSHFQIAAFQGSFVEFVCPPSAEKEPHETFKPFFDQYLEKAPLLNEDDNDKENAKDLKKANALYNKKQKQSREQLMRSSFKNLVSLSVDDFKNQLCVNDYYFIVDALVECPDLLDTIQGEVKKYTYETISSFYDREFKGKVGEKSEEGKLFDKRKTRFLSVIKKLEMKRQRLVTKK